MKLVFQSSRLPLLVVVFWMVATCRAAEPIKVGGVIAEDATWSGNVTVVDDVTVTRGATLTIQPGTSVAFTAGTALNIEGRLLADAGQGEPIVFGPVAAQTDKGAEKGMWSGITIGSNGGTNIGDLPAGSILAGCRIAGADNGVAVLTSALQPHRVSGCTIASCRQAGVRIEGVRAAIVEGNQFADCGSAAGEGGSPTEPGGIWLQSSDDCHVRGNTIRNCHRYAVLVLYGSGNTVQDNTIEGVGGRPMSTEGYGISVSSGAARNLLEGNRITGANYIGIAISDSPDNLIIDNEVRNAPDGLGMTGPRATGNIVRNNRIYGCYWSQLYLTSQCSNNRIENTDIWGGDGAITSFAAGPNTFVGCDFHGTGPIALLGTSQVTLRRCTISTRGPDDLWTEFEPTCTLVDCNVRRERIGFSKGTTDKSHIVFKRTVRVRVTDLETGRPIHGGAVTCRARLDESGPQAEEPFVAATSPDGLATIEAMEGVVSKGEGFTPAPPPSLSVEADGYQTRLLAELDIHEPAVLAVELQRE